MVIITAFKPVILPSAQTQNLFHFCFQVKRCQVEVETSESLEGIFPDDPINGCQKSSKNIRFTISGTSKFSGARQVVGKIGKEVLLRRTLAYGTRYGIGVFCLTESDKLVGSLKRTKQFWTPLERHAICQTFMPKLTVQVPKIWQISLLR